MIEKQRNWIKKGKIKNWRRESCKKTQKLILLKKKKNNKFVEKVKSVSKFVQDQIDTKSVTKPKAMNNAEEKINKDIIGKLESKGMM